MTSMSSDFSRDATVPLLREDTFSFPAQNDSGEGWKFKPLRTYPWIVVYFLVFATFVASCFVPALQFDSHDVELKSKVALHVALVLLTLILERYLRSLLKKRQRAGYILFYRRVRILLPAPFRVVTAGTCVLLLVMVFDPAQIPYLHCASNTYARYLAFRAIICVELAAVLLVFAILDRFVHLHNRMAPRPDVESEFTSSLQAGLPGWRTTSLHEQPHWGIRDDLNEKQAELNRFNHERQKQLSTELLRVKAQLQLYQSAAKESVVRAELDTAVAAHERQERAITAERDQLLQELQASRQILSDRDAQVAKLQRTQQEHVVENARCRAMLEEWSSRSAKLESKLEMYERQLDAYKESQLQKGR